MNDNHDKNDPVAKTTMTLTLLHHQDLDPRRMQDVDIANHLADGSFIGGRTMISTVELADAEVDPELERLGMQPGQFEIGKATIR